MAKRKKKNKKSSIQSFFCSIVFLLSLILILYIVILNVLDLVHLGLIIGVLLFLFLFLVILIKKKRLLGCILSIIICILYVFLIFNINKTISFFNGLELNYKTYHYSVIVLKSSNFHKLGDIRDRKLGYYDDGSQENEKALDKVRKKEAVEIVSFEDTHKMADALLMQELDAILIENSYLDILDESISEDGETFKNLIRKIYDFVILTKTSDISRDTNVTKEPFNIYVSGIDTYGEISSVSRSDVNMVVTVNPATRQILLTSVPRDYYVKLHGKNGNKDKLTHAGLYGIDMSVQTLEDLLDIKINYYVKVNFTSVVKIVDAIGGVRVYSDYDFTSLDYYHYKKGYNDLNGEEALSFARERKAFASGDRQRIQNQQALLSAIFDKVTSKQVITKYSKLLDSMNGSFVTNMKISRLTSLMRLQLAKNYSWNLVSNSLKGKDSSNYTYSASSVKSYVMEPIDSSVEEAHSLINQIMNGDKIHQDDIGKETISVVSHSKSSSQDVSSSSDTKKETNQSSVATTHDDEGGLEVKLVRNLVQFPVGDEFIYYGYMAKYQGNDVTHSNEIQESFTIQGKKITDYKELVLYVSRLPAGEYTIVYHVQYKKESVDLEQKVVIQEVQSTVAQDEDVVNDYEENEDDEQE